MTSKTRAEYAAELDAHYQRSVPFGGNDAIRKHRDKVLAMSDDEWPAHEAQLEANSRAFKNTGMLARLAEELADEMRSPTRDC